MFDCFRGLGNVSNIKTADGVSLTVHSVPGQVFNEKSLVELPLSDFIVYDPPWRLLTELGIFYNPRNDVDCLIKNMNFEGKRWFFLLVSGKY